VQKVNEDLAIPIVSRWNDTRWKRLPLPGKG